MSDDVQAVLSEVVMIGDEPTPQALALAEATRRRIELIDRVTGLLSTIDFTPSTEHPARVRLWSVQVLELLEETP